MPSEGNAQSEVRSVFSIIISVNKAEKGLRDDRTEPNFDR